MAGPKNKSKTNSESKLEKSIVQLRNKERQKLKYEKRILTQQILKAERLTLLAKVKEQTGLTKSQLNRKFGTLNIKRLNDIISHKVETSQWYIRRVESQLVDKNVPTKLRMFKQKQSTQVSGSRKTTKNIPR